MTSLQPEAATHRPQIRQSQNVFAGQAFDRWHPDIPLARGCESVPQVVDRPIRARKKFKTSPSYPSSPFRHFPLVSKTHAGDGVMER